MKSIIFIPLKDYFFSRKTVLIKFLIPMLIALAALLLSIFFNIGNSEKVISTFSGFIDTQINIVAILISFSIAIITILGGCKIFCVYGNETFQIRIRYVVVLSAFANCIFVEFIFLVIVFPARFLYMPLNFYMLIRHLQKPKPFPVLQV